jgi:anti-sigma-K factor RskA
MNPHDSPQESSNDALLAGHALGDLDEAEREQLAALLVRSPQLRERLGEFQTTLELLPLALPAATPPLRLRHRLLEQRDRRPSPARPFAWMITAMLGVAVIGLGIVQQQTRQQLAQLQNQLNSQAQSEIRSAVPSSATAPRRLSLEATTAGLQTNGEVMVTGNPTHNVLMLNNLPSAPPRHFYRLWARVDGELVGCVSFVPTEQGHVAMLIPPMPTSLATSVSVSLETDPIGRSPTGPMLLSSSL